MVYKLSFYVCDRTGIHSIQHRVNGRTDGRKEGRIDRCIDRRVKEEEKSKGRLRLFLEKSKEANDDGKKETRERYSFFPLLLYIYIYIFKS
jgi:hypothetical protein